MSFPRNGFRRWILSQLPTCSFGDDIRPKSKADAGKKKISGQLTDDVEAEILH
ncbi:hypothetical protein KIN20_009008 [Parelaphostrongylus tenuis]|uniref:Uncharacterized protein n=1 Tax=Parelaphostrongylus tenuis TaxID=148309 RepID=A0AAD5M8T8_PARTN|nr:hypothetical protein KIN20_009008 [Parelaphostrongylus tenuis]